MASTTSVVERVFSAIDVHETEVPFHEPWEARVIGNRAGYEPCG